MESLRERMIEDMMLAGLAPDTRRIYLLQVRKLAKHYMVAPEMMKERQVRDYFVYLREEKKVPRGTFKTVLGGVRFCFFITLDRDWALFSKKRSRCRCRNGCRTLVRMKRFGSCWRRFASRFTERVCARCTLAVCG